MTSASAQAAVSHSFRPVSSPRSFVVNSMTRPAVRKTTTAAMIDVPGPGPKRGRNPT